MMKKKQSFIVVLTALCTLSILNTNLQGCEISKINSLWNQTKAWTRSLFTTWTGDSEDRKILEEEYSSLEKSLKKAEKICNDPNIVKEENQINELKNQMSKTKELLRQFNKKYRTYASWISYLPSIAYAAKEKYQLGKFTNKSLAGIGLSFLLQQGINLWREYSKKRYYDLPLSFNEQKTNLKNAIEPFQLQKNLDWVEILPKQTKGNHC